MAKETKKPVRKAAMPLLNSKNLTALADSIFKDDGNVVTYTKLCDGNLCSKEGKKVIHCAIGEAYHVFVSSEHKDMLKLNKLEKHRSPYLDYDLNDEDCDDDCDCSYSPLNTDVDDPGTIKAVDELTARAELKKKGPEAQKDFAYALLDIVTTNDDSDEVGFAGRSESVSKAFRRVAKLLK